MLDHDPLPASAGLDKELSLGRWLRARGSALVGFSGGVDSTYLACVALEVLGAHKTLAVIGRSASYPAVQWEMARATASQLDLPVIEIETDELQDQRYAANPTDRCYFCKTELWSKLVPMARSRGFATVVDGTNADDLSGHRPGMRAARELGVESPLADVGFTKVEIRDRSRHRGLPTWRQPASPCLSSRIPYGVAVNAERLAQIERAEAALRGLGVTGDLRVRYHGDLARVELAPGELPVWLEPRAQRRMRAALREAGFTRVAIDLAGFRSGSLNVLTGVSAA